MKMPCQLENCGPAANFFKLLSGTPDADDLTLHTKLADPELVTQRLHQLVPLLEFIGCVVDYIGPDKTVLTVPLMDPSMNQNGTHQASVFYLVADYTLGVGMFGAIPGIYVTGIHDRCRALPVQYWLKKGSVQHLAPGTGQLRAEVQIPKEKAAELRGQLIAKGRGETTEMVRFFQNDQLVATAEHTMGLYIDAPRTGGARASLFQVQNMKTSALMIAGLRDDPISKVVASEQGRAIATRMAVASPQLSSLVKARSLHLDTYLAGGGNGHRQVVVLGVGLDPKPVIFSRAEQHWYGIDLREMLREREKRFSAGGFNAARFSPIVADVRLDNWDAQLAAAGFTPDLSTLVICEGFSMYFPANEFCSILRKARALCSHTDSRVWMDHVTSRIFEMDAFEVKTFLSTMTRLGEPFVLGFESPTAVGSRQWAVVETTSASDVLGLTDVIHDEYRFALLSGI
jgi:O-methyltransferase involved in polyketide biosynthesis/acyl-coenzyme A thioesterase PaaI-like protein